MILIPLLKESKIICKMRERLAPTGSGFPTVYIGDQALHSRYNPRSEAEKYVNSLTFRGEPFFFVLIEPGLGYTIPALRKRFPSAMILSLHVSDFFRDAGSAGEADAVWGPGTGIPLQQFLEGRIPDIDAMRIGIIEWRPSLAVYGGEYLRLFAETTEFIKRIDANKRTIRNFGRRWFRNVIKNIRLIRQVPHITPLSYPLVITGAGPSLEETIPLIRKRRQQSGFFVLAAASSVSALLAGGVVPDLTLSTDGGGWALLHLYEALRRLPETGFAAALCAALPSQMAALPWLPLGDGSLWQNLLLGGAGCPQLNFPQRGTVTASAIDLAFALTSGPVYITGTDLACRDLRTHSRPYAFDRLMEADASRLSPAYSCAFTRAAEASGSHGIYADWFRRHLDSYPPRLFSLGSNNPVFSFRQAGDFSSDSGDGKKRRNLFEIIEIPGERDAAYYGEILNRGLETADTAEILIRELAPLLLPDVSLKVTSSCLSNNDMDLGKKLKEEITRICGETHG
jgi:hypothetical protein